MDDFALVTEGPSDQAVLENILFGYFKEQREPAVNRELPNPQDDKGGWTLLFQYLREKKFRDAFQLNRYLIIQVDTDVSEEPGFDVPHHDEHGPLTPDELVEKIIERLKEEIGEPYLTIYAGKFIFAIAMDEIECWVLPLWYEDAHAESITGCIAKLGHCAKLKKELKEQRLRWIRPEEKKYTSYAYASRGYRKPKPLAEIGRKNPSLALFLDQLDQMDLTLPPEE